MSKISPPMFDLNPCFSQEEKQFFRLSFWQQIRCRLLAINPEETKVSKRGFAVVDPAKGQRLEQIGQAFLQGYHWAIALNDPSPLPQRLQTLDPALQGFAYEGSAMGLALLDALTPWHRSRFIPFAKNEGNPHIYLVYVGMGWALARVPGSLSRYLNRLTATDSSGIDPLLGWLAIDGYGFHQGYFSWPQYIERFMSPQGLSGYAARVFDQGLGRSLWFVKGAEPAAIAQAIQRFPPSRRGDLWSGVGLAGTYAGGMNSLEMEILVRFTQDYFAPFAQGVAFAAKARQRAGQILPTTEKACQVFCGQTAQQLAAITDEMLQDLQPEGDLPLYEVWRQRIQAHLAQPVGKQGVTL